jgi:hypothetical protein
MPASIVLMASAHQATLKMAVARRAPVGIISRIGGVMAVPSAAPADLFRKVIEGVRRMMKLAAVARLTLGS